MSYRLDGDTAWVDGWRLEAGPPDDEVAELRRWLQRLRDDPRQLPSARSSQEHPYPQDELRAAFLLDAGGVFIVYAVDEGILNVRILHIGDEPPEGVVIPLPL